jgi:hypothetical protein
MKNKILYGIAVMVIAVIAAFNVTLSLQKNNNLSDLSLANIEALADGENGNCPGNYCSYSNYGETCSTCCPFGKSAICNALACSCQS